MPKIKHDIDFEKTQTKLNDCWYACIQMIRSWKKGTKTKPQGPTTLKHRDTVFGKTLNFGASGGAGDKILKENELIDLTPQKIKGQRWNLSNNTVQQVHDALQEYGPLILSGKYGAGGFLHCVVLSGIDTANGTCTVSDPAWVKGTSTNTSWDKLAEKLSKMTGDDTAPDAGAIVCNKK